MDKLCFLLTQNCLCFHIDDSTPYNISFHLHTLSTNFNSIGQNNGNITMNLFLVFYWKKCMGSSRWSGTAGHSQGHQWDRFWGHQSYFSCCTLWHPAWAWCRPHPSWIPTWSSALQPSCRATRSCAMRCPGARLRSTSTTFCHQWFRFWSNLSPPAMYWLYCSSWTRYWWGGPALDPVLADGAGVLAVPLNQNVDQLLGGKKSMSPKCDRQTRWKKSNFCLQKTHTNRNSNGIQSPIIYKIRCN